MARFLRDNSLSLFFLVIFLAALAGQAIAGHNLYNEEQEYLQFALFALATVWLIQRGSPESKPVGAPPDDATGKAG